jgi:ketosteroid isomerase-like protein
MPVNYQSMGEWHIKIKQLFEDYEKANTEFDVQRIASFYAEIFMLADPPRVGDPGKNS